MEVVGEEHEHPLIFAPTNYAWQKKVAEKLNLEIVKKNKKNTVPAKQRGMEMKDGILFGLGSDKWGFI